MVKTETAALSFRNELMTMVRELVWKNGYKAFMCEDEDHTDNVSVYTWAAKKFLETHSSTELKNMLAYDDVRYSLFLEKYADNTVMIRACNILRSYVEYNDYYRELAGLPPLHPTYTVTLPTKRESRDWYVKIFSTDTPVNPNETAVYIPWGELDKLGLCAPLNKLQISKLSADLVADRNLKIRVQRNTQRIEGSAAVHYYCNCRHMSGIANHLQTCPICGTVVSEHVDTAPSMVDASNEYLLNLISVRTNARIFTTNILQTIMYYGNAEYSNYIYELQNQYETEIALIRETEPDSTRAILLEDEISRIVSHLNMMRSNVIRVYEVTYLHELPKNALERYEYLGYFDALYEILNRSHPRYSTNYRYLKHLTAKKIHPYQARLADKFDILYLPMPTLSTLYDDFIAIYNASKEFVIQRYYTESYRLKYEFYDGFIGMAILFMTLQRMNVAYLDVDITRDFYDLDSLKLVYEAYSVPFYPEIPIKYHFRVVKAINRLLSYKGSNQVFFDLAALFDFDTLNVYQYYLVKTQPLDNEGRPIWHHYQKGDPECIVDPKTGAVIEDKDIDYEKTFDVHFVKRTIHKESYFEAINNPTNYLNYREVIQPDPYWLDDADLREKMYRSEYNFIETKYIGFETQVSMSKYFFETIYFMQMIKDNRKVFENLRVDNEKLGTRTDIFTLVVYIMAMICKKLGWTGLDPDVPDFNEHPFKVWPSKEKFDYGNIPTDPSKVARILGFNFKADLKQIFSDLLMSSSKNSLRIEDSNGNGWYIFPTAVNYAQTEERTAGNNVIVTTNEYWKDATLSVYKLEDGYVIKKLAEFDEDCSNVIGGIGYGTSPTRIIDTETYKLTLEDKGKLTAKDLRDLGYSDEAINMIFGKVIEFPSMQNLVISGNVRKVAYDALVAIGKSDVEIQDILSVGNTTYRLKLNDASSKVFVKKTHRTDHDYDYATIPDDEALLKIFDGIDLDDVTSVNSHLKISATYESIKELASFIENKMLATSDRNIFQSYSHLRKVLLTTTVLPESIEKTDANGNTSLATSYVDLLETLDMPLAIRLLNLNTQEELRSELDYSLLLLQRTCSNLTYITSYGSYNTEVVVEYLYKLLLFFKSVKVQLLDFNVIYVFDSNVENMLKFLSELVSGRVQSLLDGETSLAVSIFDVLDRIYEVGYLESTREFRDVLLQLSLLVHLKSLLITDDRIALSRLKVLTQTFLGFFDIIEDNDSVVAIIDKLNSLNKELEIDDRMLSISNHKRMNTVYAILVDLSKAANSSISDIFTLLMDNFHNYSTTRLGKDSIGMTTSIPGYNKNRPTPSRWNHVKGGSPYDVRYDKYFLYTDKTDNLGDDFVGRALLLETLGDVDPSKYLNQTIYYDNGWTVNIVSYGQVTGTSDLVVAKVYDENNVLINSYRYNEPNPDMVNIKLNTVPTMLDDKLIFRVSRWVGDNTPTTYEYQRTISEVSLLTRLNIEYLGEYEISKEPVEGGAGLLSSEKPEALLFSIPLHTTGLYENVNLKDVFISKSGISAYTEYGRFVELYERFPDEKILLLDKNDIIENTTKPTSFLTAGDLLICKRMTRHYWYAYEVPTNLNVQIPQDDTATNSENWTAVLNLSNGYTVVHNHFAHALFPHEREFPINQEVEAYWKSVNGDNYSNPRYYYSNDTAHAIVGNYDTLLNSYITEECIVYNENGTPIYAGYDYMDEYSYGVTSRRYQNSRYGYDPFYPKDFRLNCISPTDNTTHKVYIVIARKVDGEVEWKMKPLPDDLFPTDVQWTPNPQVYPDVSNGIDSAYLAVEPDTILGGSLYKEMV